MSRSGTAGAREPTGGEVSILKSLTVIGTSGGHEWVDPTENNRSKIPGVFCRLCLLMRRADGKNKTCRGPVKLVLRANQARGDQRNGDQVSV